MSPLEPLPSPPPAPHSPVAEHAKLIESVLLRLDVSIEASPETAKGFLDSVRSAVDALIEDAKRLEERLSFCEHVAGRR